MNSPTPHGYLDLKTLAGYASCSVRWLRNRLVDHAHPLPCYRIGGKVLVRVDEFDQWMTAHRTVAQADDLDRIINEVVAAVTAQKPS